jgi:signal transduction histidine kinase
MNTRQERLLDALLLLARAEQEVTGRAYVDLADIADHVAASAPNAKLDLQEAPTDGNPTLLERLVQNLVDNAVRHGAGELWVTTGLREGRAFLRIANTGAVIRPYEVAGLFEPFHRLAADRTAGTGLGLGLSIVRAVATAHGGHATAEARPDGGLTVMVTLPPAGHSRR